MDGVDGRGKTRKVYKLIIEGRECRLRFNWHCDMRPFICQYRLIVCRGLDCMIRSLSGTNIDADTIRGRDCGLVVHADNILRVRFQQGVCVFSNCVGYNAPSRMRRSVPRHLNCAHAAIQILFDGFPTCLHRPVPVDRTLIRLPQQIPTANGDAVHLIRHIQLQILVPANIHRVQRVDGRFAGKQIAHIDLLRRDAPRQNLVARDSLGGDLRCRNGLGHDDSSVDVILILILRQLSHG